MNIAIIGLGHWGKNYYRIFNSIPNINLLKICDNNSNLFFKNKLGFTKNVNDIYNDDEIESVIISTNATSHYQIALNCLKNNKNVLIEKPITLKLNEAEHLNKVAKKKKKVLMVGHTFLYNQSVLKLRELIKKKIAGKIYYINCRRTHLGLIRKDVNVIWDLAPHDISIVNFILKKEPLNLKVSTSQFLKKGRSDVAFLNFIYPKNILTNIHLSWLDSNKCRTIEIIGSKARILFDDLNLLEPIKIYKKKLLKKKNDQNYHLRDGNILSPQIKIKEPLFEMCKDFIKSIKYKTKPVSDFKVGYACIKALKLSNTFN